MESEGEWQPGTLEKPTNHYNQNNVSLYVGSIGYKSGALKHFIFICIEALRYSTYWRNNSLQWTESSVFLNTQNFTLKKNKVYIYLWLYAIVSPFPLLLLPKHITQHGFIRKDIETQKETPTASKKPATYSRWACQCCKTDARTHFSVIYRLRRITWV